VLDFSSGGVIGTGSGGSTSFGGGILDTIAGVGRSLFDMQVQKKAQKAAAKGGPAYPGGLGFTQGGILPPWMGNIPGLPQSPVGQIFGFQQDQMGGLIGSGQFGGCFRTSDPSRPRVTPCKVVSAVGPNGQVYEWVYRGRPVLYSGDLATTRRVNKLLGRGRGRMVRARTKRCR
jgi:hypothetical protein